MNRIVIAAAAFTAMVGAAAAQTIPAGANLSANVTGQPAQTQVQTNIDRSSTGSINAPTWQSGSATPATVHELKQKYGR